MYAVVNTDDGIRVVDVDEPDGDGVRLSVVSAWIYGTDATFAGAGRMRPDDEFGALLRAFRERMSPEAAGIGSASPAARRVPGLRRDELAGLAHVSEEHLRRLEQGRRRPSRTVVDALARALRLNRDEYAWLCLLAGFAPASEVVAIDESDGQLALLAADLDRGGIGKVSTVQADTRSTGLDRGRLDIPRCTPTRRRKVPAGERRALCEQVRPSAGRCGIGFRHPHELDPGATVPTCAGRAGSSALRVSRRGRRVINLQRIHRDG